MIKGKRSGSQNLALALPPGDVVPCRHGNTGSINTRHLGAYPVEAQAYIVAGAKFESENTRFMDT
jgi:hypothetical protein